MMGLTIIVMSDIFSPSKQLKNSVLRNNCDCKSQVFFDCGKRGEMSIFVESFCTF